MYTQDSDGGMIGQLLRTVWGYYFVSFFNTHRVRNM